MVVTQCNSAASLWALTVVKTCLFSIEGVREFTIQKISTLFRKDFPAWEDFRKIGSENRQNTVILGFYNSENFGKIGRQTMEGRNTIFNASLPRA